IKLCFKVIERLVFEFLGVQGCRESGWVSHRGINDRYEQSEPLSIAIGEGLEQVRRWLDIDELVANLCLIGYFLAASVIHFWAMRSTMTNLWHPVIGVQISDLEEKRFMFKFFHRMGLERVIKGSPWTFNNHLLMIYLLRE
ncbi:hypothetical protein Goari_004116, partial [Gossypium aridum]|nr:hypothetical protein [Gossypium aridum]